MRVRIALVIGCFGIAYLGTAGAASLDSENGRFAFLPVPEGLVRLDTRTGQLSHCARKGPSWACQAIADDRAALEAEVTRLQTENERLKRDLASRKGTGVDDSAQKGSRDIYVKLPNEADLDRLMGVLERAWSRLVDRLAILRGKS